MITRSVSTAKLEFVKYSSKTSLIYFLRLINPKLRKLFVDWWDRVGNQSANVAPL
jgi:hypothetical protein